MKKIQKIISCLCIMCMLICMSNTIAWAEETKGTETKSVESVQQMINELPSMHEINDTNKDAVIAQLDAIDDAKLQLSDEEIMQIDFTKYNAAAFVLSDSLHLAKVIVHKTYPEAVGPTAAISFLNENGQMETMLQEGSGGVSTCSSVEPVPNGAATYAYIEAGHYTLNEEVEGEWNASLTVNGQPVEGMEVDFEAGKFYSVMLTNSYQPPETITVSGEITWDDENNQDGKRPDAVTVKLFANGDDTGKTATVNAEDNWVYEFEDLSVYENGEEILYSVDIDEAVTDYAMTISGDANTGFEITLTHMPEKTNISGEIIWDDANDQGGKRPTEVTVKLLEDEVDLGRQITANATGDWKYKFENLPKYKDGQEIIYTVQGAVVDGYESAQDGNNITYTKPTRKNITVQITWDDANNQDGKRQDVWVDIYRDCGSGEKWNAGATLNADNSWQYTFDNRDIYGPNGVEWTYSVKPPEVDGYISEVNGYNITYTRSTEIFGQITWEDADNQDGKRPEQVAIKLVEDGGTIERTVGRSIGRNVTVTADADWKYSFKDLPKYRGGREIVYGVNATVEGYTLTTTGYDIKCTHTPETIDVTGTITWEDADDQDGKRPEKVKVELLANGESIGKTKTVTVKDNWSYRFKDLPKYKAGKEIEYTIKNEGLEGYTLIIDDNNNLTYLKIEEKTETPEDKKPESEDKKPISEDKKPESEDKKPVSEDKTSTSNAPTTSGNGISSNPAQTKGASSNSVPTGDINNLWLAGLLFIVALYGLCVSIQKRSDTVK